MKLVRIPFRRGAARGVRYGEVPSDVDDRLETWLATRDVDDGVAIKASRVYRRGEWVIKFFEPHSMLGRALRKSPAERSADLHERLWPLRTPAPLVALRSRRGARPGLSMLVARFLEGRTLDEVWDEDERAMAALGGALAEMHRRRIFHGDFHPENLVWTGSEWGLIDLVGIRHPLRSLRTKQLVIEAWAELEWRLGSPPSLKQRFDDYLRASDLGWQLEKAWARVTQRAREMRADRSTPAART